MGAFAPFVVAGPLARGRLVLEVDEFVIMMPLSAMIAFILVYTWLTWRAFHGLGGADLRREVLASVHAERREGWRARLMRRSFGVGSAPSWSIQLSVFALGVCLVLATNPQARAIPWALVGCIVAVVVSWCNVVLSYALHYARLDLTEGGLEFPGTEERAFSDYLYHSLNGQVTFGTTDVSVTTRQMRRAMMVHALVAFAFNTVIIAILVSLLLAGRA